MGAGPIEVSVLEGWHMVALGPAVVVWIAVVGKSWYSSVVKAEDTAMMGVGWHVSVVEAEDMSPVAVLMLGVMIKVGRPIIQRDSVDVSVLEDYRLVPLVAISASVLVVASLRWHSSVAEVRGGIPAAETRHVSNPPI